MPLRITLSEEEADHVACDALVIGVSSGDDGISLGNQDTAVDASLDGQVSAYLRDSGFKAKVGEMAILPTLGRLPAREVAVVGLGDAPADATTVRRAAGAAARRLSERSDVATTLHQAIDSDEGVSAASEGFLLGSYQFTTYKSDPHPSKLQRVALLGKGSDAALERAHAHCEAAALARDLTNEPASTLTPDALARRAREIADVGGLECNVLDERELEERGFGGLMTVGKGSEEPPRLIRLRYAPAEARGKVAVVGKGVTYDSGGLSIKDARSMETMKTDMAGAAAVIGAMSALRRLDADLEVLGFVPAVENMPGGHAVRPGDVISHYGGKTSEVNNTDAEGRLILGDAIAYACEHKPDAIVDLATLTGGIMVALGQKSTGLFATDDALAEEIRAAGEAAGERMWRMPLYDDYMKQLESEVADMKNSGTRYGSAIIGALFVKAFVADNIPWAHLDIAGTARSDGNQDEIPKGGTGVGVRTLLNWIDRRGRSS